MCVVAGKGFGTERFGSPFVCCGWERFWHREVWFAILICGVEQPRSRAKKKYSWRRSGRTLVRENQNLVGKQLFLGQNRQNSESRFGRVLHKMRATPQLAVENSCTNEFKFGFLQSPGLVFYKSLIAALYRLILETKLRKTAAEEVFAAKASHAPSTECGHLDTGCGRCCGTCDARWY